jgi:hypothetical protein
MKNIKKYEKIYRSYLYENSNIIFQNIGIDYSLSFTSVFYSIASDLIMISDGFKNNLTSNSYYINNLILFLNKNNSKLKIAIESLDNLNVEPLLSIKRFAIKYPDRFEIFHISDVVINDIKSKFGYFPDIMIADKKMFRFENESNHCFSSFNNIDQCDKLVKYCDYIFNNSKHPNFKSYIRKEKLKLIDNLE